MLPKDSDVTVELDPGAPAVLEIAGLSKNYGETLALSDVSVQFRSGTVQMFRDDFFGDRCRLVEQGIDLTTMFAAVGVGLVLMGSLPDGGQHGIEMLHENVFRRDVKEDVPEKSPDPPP